MSAVRKYQEARSAYEAERDRVRSESGCGHEPEPYDITGGFVMEDSAWGLLKNPTKAKAAEIYHELLHYAEHTGWDVGTGHPFFPTAPDKGKG